MRRRHGCVLPGRPVFSATGSGRYYASPGGAAMLRQRVGGQRASRVGVYDSAQILWPGAEFINVYAARSPAGLAADSS
jgi:hypothetical protein